MDVATHHALELENRPWSSVDFLLSHVPLDPFMSRFLFLPFFFHSFNPLFTFTLTPLQLFTITRTLPRSIPIEILIFIFCNLGLQDLYLCLFVSRRWHDPAEAQLYSDVTLQKTYKPLITTLKTRRHLLSSIRWRFARGCELLESDLLAIHFDKRPVRNTHDEGSQDQRPGKQANTAPGNQGQNVAYTSSDSVNKQSKRQYFHQERDVSVS